MCFWLSRRAFALLAAALLLAGCGDRLQHAWWNPLGFLGDLPRPFQPESRPADPRFVVTPGQAGISIRPIAGLRPDAAAELSDAIARALQALSYPASTRPGNVASYTMVGRVGGQAPNGQALLTISLVGADGRIIANHPAGLDPREVAAAAHQVDWNPLAQDIAAAIDALIQENAQATVAAQRPPVMIGRIEGLNAEGTRDLTRSLRWSFARMRQRVVDQPRPDVVIVEGAIAISRPQANTVSFQIMWTLRRPDGVVLGQARQDNDVDTVMLEQSWPQVAIGIAEGAVEGISQVIDQSPFTPATPLGPGGSPLPAQRR